MFVKGSALSVALASASTSFLLWDANAARHYEARHQHKARTEEKGRILLSTKNNGRDLPKVLDDGISVLSNLEEEKLSFEKNYNIQDELRGTRFGEAAADVGILGGPAATQRRLQNSIGDGSCEEGTNVCLDLGDIYTIGTDSCNGNRACRGIAVDSEIGAIVGDSACVGPRACDYSGRQMNGFINVGDNSCIGPDSYEQHGVCEAIGYAGSAIIGANSCTGKLACYYIGGEDGAAVVGEFSCTADDACRFMGYPGGQLTIGDRSCTELGSCDAGSVRGATVTIGSDSCNCEGCCENLPNGSEIGDCQCNDRSDGCFRTEGDQTPVIMLGTCDSPPPPSGCAADCVANFPEGKKGRKGFCKDTCKDADSPGRCKGKCISTVSKGGSASDVCETLCREVGTRRLLRGEGGEENAESWPFENEFEGEGEVDWN